MNRLNGDKIYHIYYYDLFQYLCLLNRTKYFYSLYDDATDNFAITVIVLFKFYGLDLKNISTTLKLFRDYNYLTT